jgi:DNA-binding GntR family transcriptional regulator
MTETLREKIYQKIRDDIMYGRFVPGERLVETRLVKEFNASRTPIREALRQMETEGMITFQRNRGITVTKLSTKEVDEIYTLRCLLEGFAARLSAEKCIKKDLVYLSNLQKKLEKAARDFELVDWLENNSLFHNYFLDNCENSNLIQVLDALKRRVYRYQYTGIRIPGHFEAYLAHHRAIIEACESKNGKKAEKYMRIHLEKVRDVLLDYLNKALL